jgi:hypothetical protein
MKQIVFRKKIFFLMMIFCEIIYVCRNPVITVIEKCFSFDKKFIFTTKHNYLAIERKKADVNTENAARLHLLKTFPAQDSISRSG